MAAHRVATIAGTGRDQANRAVAAPVVARRTRGNAEHAPLLRLRLGTTRSSLVPAGGVAPA